LFKQSGRDDEEGDFDSEDDESNGLDSRWKWYSLIEKLAGGDITKFDNVFKENYIGCLNLLSYWKEKDEYLRELEKQNKNKNKIK